MRGCLATAGLLVAPAVEDLRTLNPRVPNAPSDGEPQPDDPTPLTELIDHHHSAIAVIDGNALDEAAFEPTIGLEADRVEIATSGATSRRVGG